jgi:hypothetical protein
MALPEPRPDSTCLVTGASSGIGTEVARQLAARGHGVLLVARREDRLRDLAAEIERDHGVRAETMACDLADTAARDVLLGVVDDRGLEVEVLVNNAGFSTVGDFHADTSHQTEMVRLNCEAVVDLTAAYLPEMVRRRRGAVINVASVAAFQPIPVQAVYAASKAFVLSFTEAIASELKGTGVTATALCPGPVRTEFAEVAGFGRSPDEMGPSFIWAAPADVARAAIEGAEKGKRVVVPGVGNRASALFGQYTPHMLLLGPVAGVYRRVIGE